ncbi:Membrane-bound lytic murein transglycosylase D [Bacteroidales bacterium CF]|jgi:Soluble lytic murein transglycosylase and related regulatory proteins (some contain LysM/invasin domains)|nr:Membrane-bound lytic murein transglycosylase D [Bacteroidales bacterium CF]
MKIRTLFFVLLTVVFSTELSYGQLLTKKPTKKELLTEIQLLRKTIDSLKNELSGAAIELSDTVSTNDTINPGVINFFEGEDLIESKISTDSLLSLYYVQKKFSMVDDLYVDLDSAKLKSDIPDSVFIARLKAMNSFIPLPYNDIIKNHIVFYTQKIPHKIDLILGMSAYYLPIFEEIIDQYDLPKELRIMAVIESALNPNACSRVKARGLWQFMYRTALQYNLKINSYVDERLDPIASTHAACKYLKDSYTIFGDWALAIASYNCGAGNVNKAIRRAGSRDFWKIYPYLPRETRGYVPSFVAALYTLNYYKEHKIVPRAISMPAHVDTFMIHKPLHFGQISEVVGVTVEELQNLNPQYIKQIIPGSPEGMVLNLPYQYTTTFVNNEDSIYTYKDSLFFNPIIFKETKGNNLASSSSGSERSTSYTHIVRKGETLGGIAMKYGVKLSDLQRWNHTKSKISIGQTIVIHGRRSSSSDDEPSYASAPQTKKSGGYVYYTVRRGDTLWGISRKFEGVTLNDILELNGLTKNSKIAPGKKLKIKRA